MPWSERRASSSATRCWTLPLARDLASLAVRGGYLIFGVEEDKASHKFTVVDTPLPAHLDQAVDQVARDFIDPPPTGRPDTADQSRQSWPRDDGDRGGRVARRPQPHTQVGNTHPSRTVPVAPERLIADQLLKRRPAVRRGRRQASNFPITFRYQSYQEWLALTYLYRECIRS